MYKRASGNMEMISQLNLLLNRNEELYKELKAKVELLEKIRKTAELSPILYKSILELFKKPDK